MSIINEIDRIQNAKDSLKEVLEENGISVPSSAKIEAYPNYIDALGLGEYVKKPLTIVTNTTGTFSITIPSHQSGMDNMTYISYKVGDGEWYTRTLTSYAASISEYITSSHTTIQIKADGWRWGGSIKFDGKFDLEGNISSLLYGENLGTDAELTIDDSGLFPLLFQGNTTIIDASGLVLPATTVSNECYYGMFYGCTSLVKAPVILPAITLGENCYQEMFRGCTSLTHAPILPATIMSNGCYIGMFNGCTSLVHAPQLPATNLATSCYETMFEGCQALVVAPKLPAVTLVDSCYSNMFNGCSSLKYVNARFEIPSKNDYTDYMYNWLNDTYQGGLFIKNPDATWSDAGIRSEWLVKTSDEVSMPIMVLWMDDFKSDSAANRQQIATDYGYSTFEEYIAAYVANPGYTRYDSSWYGWGSNGYMHLGDTFTWNGQSYLLWINIDCASMSSDYGGSSCVKYLLTEDVGICELHGNSMAYSISTATINPYVAYLQYDYSTYTTPASHAEHDYIIKAEVWT